MKENTKHLQCISKCNSWLSIILFCQIFYVSKHYISIYCFIYNTIYTVKPCRVEIKEIGRFFLEIFKHSIYLGQIQVKTTKINPNWTWRYPWKRPIKGQDNKVLLFKKTLKKCKGIHALNNIWVQTSPKLKKYRWALNSKKYVQV